MLLWSKVSTFLSITLAMLALLQPSQGISFSPQNACQYRGYAPGSVNSVGRTSAEKPEAFQSSMLQTGLDYFMKGSGVSAAALGVIDAVGDVMKAAPQLTAAIGIISVGLGFLQNSPSPEDVLDKAYESVQLLSDEVNVMMDQMQDYVDARDLGIEKTIMTSHYHEAFDRWFGCAKELTATSVNDCQRRAVEAIRTKRSHFQRHHDLFTAKIYDSNKGVDKPKYDPDFNYRKSTGWWQWMDENCNKKKPKYPLTPFYCLSHYQVKQLEIGIVPFRDYASLHLLALQALAASYKPNISKDKLACGYYKRYLQELVDSGEAYAKYAEWAYQWDYIRQYEENEFLGMTDRWRGRPATAFRGGYLGTKKCSGNKCTMQCSQMFKENTCTATGGASHQQTQELGTKCDAYLQQVKKQLNKFWDEKVLNSAKLWRKYSEEAKKKLDAAKCAS